MRQTGLQIAISAYYIRGRYMEDPELETLERVSSFVTDHSLLYSHIEVGLCVARRGEHLRAVSGKIMPVPRLDKGGPEETLDYGSIILTRFHLPVDEFSGVLLKGLPDGTVDHPELGPIEASGKLSVRAGDSLTPYRQEGQRPYGYVTSRWSFFRLEHRPNKQEGVGNEPLVRPELPVFPNWYTGAHFFLGLSGSPEQASSFQEVALLVPDPRARLDKVRLRGSELSIVLGEGEYGLDELLVKVYGATDEQVQNDVEVSPESWEITHVFPFEAEAVSVHVLSKETGENLDWREFYIGWGRFPGGVVVERSEGGLLELMRRGEGPHVEFKRLSEDPKFNVNLCKAISAFANTEGGVLFLGVDDEGMPVDNVDPSEEDRILKLVTSHVDPPVEDLRFQMLLTDEHQILTIEVPEGDSKPYLLQDHGVFVRHGATSRQATRSELMNMLQKKGGGIGQW